jgi:8-oxo-dGTP pyrophosphatase MutT (NUDIX family)
LRRHIEVFIKLHILNHSIVSKACVRKMNVNVEIKDAASVILIRNKKSNPSVLMGQRGRNAAFMPNKFVFPGGAVEDDDFQIKSFRQLNATCKARMAYQCCEDLVLALTLAAVRELFEETGIIVGIKEKWTEIIPSEWKQFADLGFVPDASNFQFVFRAITPPGRPRRFDARFLYLDADTLSANTDLDNFSRASDELSHLQWIPIQEVRKFDLPFITEVVFAEVTSNLNEDLIPERVPFFQNSDGLSEFSYIS